MENELSSNFDIIVLGTGFVESLVAAASARIGKKVLHLDSNGFYGGQWASFSLTTLQDWADKITIKKAHPTDSEPANLLKEGEELNALSLPNSLYDGVKYQWHVPEGEETPSVGQKSGEEGTTASDDSAQGSQDVPSESKKVWTRKSLQNWNRKFNIDLAPKILFSRGALVELLISSNVARYVEFKCITRVLTWVDKEEENAAGGKLIIVPCSRSDVFTTDVISLIEKRLLMKFLEFCYLHEKNKEDWADYADKPFKEFLESRDLTPKLIHFITSAIGMVDEEASTEEGLKKTSLFLNSLGRYGSMPFLFTLFGSGEMPQAFCRLCAVFEGIYMLRRSVEYLIVKDGVFCGIASEGERFTGEHLVMDCGYAPTSFKTITNKKQSVSRGVFVTDRSIMSDEKEQLTILRMPSGDENHSAVTIIELGSGCAVCPKDTYLVHLICGGEDAAKDLQTTCERLFNREENSPDKPNVLYSLFFNQVNYDLEKSYSEALPTNVHVGGGPDAALDYDEAIKQARNIFSKIFPDEEFLPRAPDPSDIVFGDSDEKASREEQEKKQEEEEVEERQKEALNALETNIKELELAEKAETNH